MNPLRESTKLRDLLQAKRELPSRLDEILPEEILCNELLMNFLVGMIAPDPNRRFPECRSGRACRQGGGGVPSAIDSQRHGDGIRQRHSCLAGGVAAVGRCELDTGSVDSILR